MELKAFEKPNQNILQPGGGVARQLQNIAKSNS